jgi:SlyX protein
MNAENRLTGLEIRTAEQERTIEELSDALAEQWKAIEKLQRQLKRLSDRVETVEENARPETPVTKPPHY